MQIFFSFIFLALTFSANFVIAGHPRLRGTDNQAKALIETICKFPKAIELINKATEEGTITLKINRDRSQLFEAMWECGTREITLDGMKGTSRGMLLKDLIFELHNAVTTREDARIGDLARKGAITCDQYVVGVEKIEHRNVVKTAELMEEGIRARFFPEDARWVIVRNFDIHYQIQQLSGHSEAIAEEYRHFCPKNFITPYKGTVSGLKTRSSHENQKRAAELYWDHNS